MFDGLLLGPRGTLIDVLDAVGVGTADPDGKGAYAVATLHVGAGLLGTRRRGCKRPVSQEKTSLGGRLKPLGS